MRFNKITNVKAVVNLLFVSDGLVGARMTITASGYTNEEPSHGKSLIYETENYYEKNRVTDAKIEELKKGLQVDVSSVDAQNIPWEVSKTLFSVQPFLPRY